MSTHKTNCQVLQTKKHKEGKKYFNIRTNCHTFRTIILRPKSSSQYFSLTSRPFTPYATNAVLATLTLLTATAVLDRHVGLHTDLTAALRALADCALCSAT